MLSVGEYPKVEICCQVISSGKSLSFPLNALLVFCSGKDLTYAMNAT
jgi:hypothetical protein